MARRLRMSAELGDWLAELCTAVPASAAEVGAAVTAIMAAADPTALMLVGVPATEPLDPREEVDNLYQSLLEAASHMRGQEADAGTSRAGAERLLAELDNEQQPDQAVRAWLQQARDKAERQEAAVTKRSQRVQAKVDSFRTAKETAKAMYTAAEASLRVQDVIESAESEISNRERITKYQPGLPPRVADSEPADLNRGLEAAEARLQTIATEAYQTLRSVLDEAGLQAGSLRTGPARPVAGLLELHADPLGRDVRLLLAVEPSDAITLLAVLDGEDAIAEHRAQAIRMAGELLTDIRAGDWPPTDADSAADTQVTFADSGTFLARFFPKQASAIARRAAALAATRSLSALRGSVNLADLARHAGLSEQRLREIEDDGLRNAQVHEAVAYVRALGGRLTLTADLGDSPVELT